MSDEILPGPLCCDAWFTYVYVGVCSGPPLANRVSTSSIEPVHPATNSIPHHVTSSCAPFGRLCGDAWCRCILRVRDLMRNCQCSICKMCFVVTRRRGMFHTTWHSCVRTTCLESGICPTSPCTSRCGFARHRLTKKTACRQCLLHSGVRLWPCQASDGYCTGRACPSHARRRSQILWF